MGMVSMPAWRSSSSGRLAQRDGAGKPVQPRLHQPGQRVAVGHQVLFRGAWNESTDQFGTLVAERVAVDDAAEPVEELAFRRLQTWCCHTTPFLSEVSIECTSYVHEMRPLPLHASRRPG